MTVRLLVFTDLDGTLLDHDDYGWEGARPALERLAAAGSPVVIVTSKTAAEVERLRGALGNRAPYVVENGAAIIIPAGSLGNEREERELTGAPRARILEALAAIRAAEPFDADGFARLGTSGIVAATGLSERDAAEANDRLASEPLLWRDSDARLARLDAQLAEHGLHTIRGGRFVHVLGRHDKGDALRSLAGRYRDFAPDIGWHTVALGDGPNDLGMLAAADTAVIVRGRHGRPMTLRGHPDVIRTEEPGPAGWNRAVLGLLERTGTGAPSGAPPTRELP